MVVFGAAGPGGPFNDTWELTLSGPTISDQPDDVSACSSTGVTFTVTATGVTLNYQWQHDSGAGFSDLHDGGNISGATTATLALSNVSSNDAGSYHCIVQNPCGMDISNPASLTIGPATMVDPVLPSQQSICEGELASFHVSASGDALSYHWQKDGDEIGGPNSPDYVISAATPADSGSYDCRVEGTCGTVTSSATTLTVNRTTAVGPVQPAALTICEGAPASFSVSATGSNLHYQWQHDWTEIRDATADTYTISAADPNDSGSYDCVVSGDCGMQTSSAANLVVNPTTRITVQPISQTNCENASVTFSITVVGAGITYQWRKGGVGDISGATASSYTINPVHLADAGSYDCVVIGTCGTSTSAAAVLTIKQPVQILANPHSISACVGRDVFFAVDANGDPPLSYQWQRIVGSTATPIAGQTGSLMELFSITPGDAGDYDCVVCNTWCGCVTSQAAHLTVRDVTGDLNNDAKTDLSDLSILLSAYGHTGPSPADLNGDGNVDLSDLAILLGNYGAVCQ